MKQVRRGKVRKYFAKYLALALSVCLILSSFSFTATAADATKDFNSPKAAGAVTIDGNANEAGWQVSQELIEGKSANTNSTARFGAMWDENNLYFTFDVTDANVVNSGAQYPWNDDSVEVYIDGDNANSYTSHTAQFIFRWNDETVYNYGSMSSAVGIVHKAVATATGYTMEIAIPWSCVGGMTAPAAGSAIGVTAHVNDKNVNDPAAVASDTLGYTTDPGNDWQFASNWANMTLAGPAAVTGPIVYSFQKLGLEIPNAPGTYQPTQEGWSIAETSTGVTNRQQNFGMAVMSTAVGDYVKLHFEVPAAGTYSIKYRGAIAGGGAIGSVNIDSQNLGEYNYSGDYKEDTQLQDFGTVEFTQGTHELMLKVEAQGAYGWNGYFMYPIEFVIESAEVVPPPPPAVTEPIVYSFQKLGLPKGSGGTQPTQEGWKIIENSPNTPNREQGFGMALMATQIGDYVKLSFEVPATGRYRVLFKGVVAGSGGVGDIIVDGQKLTQFNFSADEYDDTLPLEPIGFMELTQGTHVLTLQVAAEGVYGWTGYFLYPSEFAIEYLPDLDSVAVAASKTEMILGQTSQLSLTAIVKGGGTIDPAAEGAEISYSSSNEAVAVVNNGVVTPVGAGQADITATVTLRGVTKQASVQVAVSDATLDCVTLTMDKTELIMEQTAQLTVSGIDTHGKALNLAGDLMEFSTSDSAIAIVSSEGVVTAVAKGQVTISVDVTIGGVTRTGTLPINVVEPTLDTVTLKSNKLQMLVGRSAQLTVTGTLNNGKPADLTGAAISYEPLTPVLASVSSDGIVTALRVGEVDIKVSVTLGGVTREATLEDVINVIDPENIVSSKTRATYYTEAKVTAARANVDKYQWAKSLKDNAVVEADKYLALGDDYLWSIVTPQSIPRVSDYMQRTKIAEHGCPNCGAAITKFGEYPWKIDPINKPWKLECPNCATVFPTNDFGKYYKSGLDEHGIFNPDLADKSLLVNELYPEKGPTWGVDDGYGIKIGDDVWTLIAYYDHWAIWYESGIVHKAIKAFRDAYIYTGDLKYAHAGIILLDRIADVYPDMDISQYLWADGFDNGVPDWHTCQGKVLNDIWETFIVTDFVSAYDAFFPALKDGDAANVVPFLSEKAEELDLGILKYSANGIKRNIEDNILRVVLPAFKDSQIRGNFGMHQAALAMTAVVLDEEGTTKEMLDFDFKTGGLDVINGSQYPNGRKFILTGGNILSTLVDVVDRDGFGNEAAPGYNRLWIDRIQVVADVLDGYDRYPEADLYQNVKFQKMFQDYPLIMLGKYIPSIGDSGACGQPGLEMDLQKIVKAYEKFNDPIYAQVAYMLNGNKTFGIHGDVFSADPDKVAQDIKNVIDTKGPLDLKSMNLTGFGLATLRDGKDYTKSTGVEYDFLQLPVSDSSGKEFKKIGFPALFYRNAGAGDYITFDFEAPETDEYNISLRLLQNILYGKFIVKIDGVQIGGEYDAYAPDVVEVGPVSFGKLTLTEGIHQITIECTGKNDSSDNYYIGLRYLLLQNKDAEEAEEINSTLGNLQRDVWMYYGRNDGHGHKDTLNLGVHAYGLDLAPDHGYPDYTGGDPDRLQWTSNTISHNTVVVNKSKQVDSWVGTPEHFDANENVSLMDVDAPKVYAGIDMYRRTTAMIKVDDANSYAVDFFRVDGGSDHHFSFHSNDASVTTEGLNLAAQTTGTYAGPDVPYKQRPVNDSVDGTYYAGAGFHYLYNVEKDTDPAEQFSIDWQQTKDNKVHLRLTMLGQYDDVAIADGQPPQTYAGNPEKLKYLIAHRSGQDLNSLFTSVIEPYKENRYIESISPVTVKAGGTVVEDGVKAVKVVLKSGRIDYIVNALDKDTTYTIDDKFQFRGFFGVYSEKDGNPVYTYINDGTMIGSSAEAASLTGTVAGFTKEMSRSNEITVQLDSQAAVPDLTGRYIYVENDGVRNAVYEIKGVKSQNGNTVVLDIGDITTIRKWVDPNDFSKGYIYDLAEGASFSIPLSSSCTIALSGAIISIDRDTLERNDTAAISVAGTLDNGDAADLGQAVIEYVSSNPEIAAVNSAGEITAGNAGSTDIYVRVTLNGVTVQSNVITVRVAVSIASIRRLIEKYSASGDIKCPLVPQLTNSLDQAEHQYGTGHSDFAVKHMEDFIKHLDNIALQANVTDTAKGILEADAKALIKMWKNQ